MSSEIAEKLSKQTRLIVSRFEERVDSFRDRKDLLQLAVGLDARAADAYAKKYFGEGEHLAFGIDGSMDFDERMQMILFYANATAYSCPFHVGDAVSFDVSRVERSSRLSASAAVPLWQEDFSEVLQDGVEIEMDLEHSVDRIPNAFMTLAELYLASKVVQESRIIFMDRPLSGTYSTLSRDLRNLIKMGTTNLGKLAYGGERLSLLDIRLGLHIGSPSMSLPTRTRFLHYRIVRELMKGGRSVSELSQLLGVKESEVTKAIRTIKRIDDRHQGELIARVDDGFIALRDGVERYWERLVKVIRGYAEAVYEQGAHPMLVGSDEWLTLLDVSAASFVLLEYLWEQAASKKVLLIGIAKDTTATDVSRAILPFAIREGALRLQTTVPRLRNDRAFLTLLGAMNRELSPPWRTRGYDAAFSTIVARGNPGEEEFLGARGVVSREKLFVRGFFQLRTLGREGRVRSPVFLFDRPFMPEDVPLTATLVVKERHSTGTIEPYFESGPSASTNLVLRVLSLCDNPEVFEAFGHNELLYLADKAVKAEMRLMKSSLRGVTNLSLATMTKREQVYGIATSFREQRAEAEQQRLRRTGESE